MPAALILTGMACGALLAAIGLAVWGTGRHTPGLPYAVRTIAWFAGGFLLVGALLAWLVDSNLSTPAPQLSLMAALSTPLYIRHRRSSYRDRIVRLLPPLILAAGSLFYTAEAGPASALGLAITVCGGLGARAFGEALSAAVTPTPRAAWSSTATFALLTLLTGGIALANLWQGGALLVETAVWARLAGAWLAWTAAGVGSRQSSWLRATFTAVATLLLVASTV